jgi:hypothetical protein
MSLQYSDYQFEKYGYMKAPEPKLNGGLYTGERFDGIHGNVSVKADGEYLTSKNLKSANPPLEARYHTIGYTRPGNNKQELPGTKQYSNVHSFRCLSNKLISKLENSSAVVPEQDLNGLSEGEAKIMMEKTKIMPNGSGNKITNGILN